MVEEKEGVQRRALGPGSSEVFDRRLNRETEKSMRRNRNSRPFSVAGG